MPGKFLLDAVTPSSLIPGLLQTLAHSGLCSIPHKNGVFLLLYSMPNRYKPQRDPLLCAMLWISQQLLEDEPLPLCTEKAFFFTP